MVRKSLIGVVALLIVIGLLWASDQITLQGERTIYSVTCEHGTWMGNRCTGTLAPAERHAFRASKTRQEVIYWVRGLERPSEKYTDCRVKDRDNWECRARDGQKPLFVDALIHGRPAFFAATSSAAFPLHAIAKWKWYALQMGFRLFTEAYYWGRVGCALVRRMQSNAGPLSFTGVVSLGETLVCMFCFSWGAALGDTTL